MKRIFLTLLALPVIASAADSVVVFNEVHYHPANEVTQTEWVELRNLHGVDVDIAGWRLEGGIAYTFPEGTRIAGGAYLVVAKVPGQIAGALGPFTGILDNGGEEIRLVNRSDRAMDVLDYADDGDWPAGADGSGATLSRRNAYSADGGPFAWSERGRPLPRFFDAMPERLRCWSYATDCGLVPQRSLPPLPPPARRLPRTWLWLSRGTRPRTRGP